MGKESLFQFSPELAEEWHPTKNGTLTPNDVTKNSHKKVWWKGKCGHEWQAAVNNRTRGNKCPVCANKIVLAGFNDLQTTNPELAEEWHPTKNGTLMPNGITKCSSKKVWWKGKCGHEWQSVVNNRSNGNQCPICSSKIVLAGFNDLQTKNPELASEWHPTKNGTLTPNDVTKSSHKKVWWKGKCGHEWDSSVFDRTNGNNCPICANQRVLAGFNDLQTIHPELAKEWHPIKNGSITPNLITKCANKNVWWKGKCGHEWQATIWNRIQGQNCPICANKIVLTGFNDLQTTNPEIASEWHPTKNGDLTPKDVTKGSHKKIWWQCKLGHEWATQIYHRTRGSNCPVCSGRTSFPEQAILFYLKQHFPDISNLNRTAVKNTELDIFLPSIQTAIEYDGVYYHQNKLHIDERKNHLCFQNHIRLIRIREEGLPDMKESDLLTIITTKPFKQSNADIMALQITIQKLFLLFNINSTINLQQDKLKIEATFKPTE